MGELADRNFSLAWAGWCFVPGLNFFHGKICNIEDLNLAFKDLGLKVSRLILPVKLVNGTLSVVSSSYKARPGVGRKKNKMILPLFFFRISFVLPLDIVYCCRNSLSGNSSSDTFTCPVDNIDPNKVGSWSSLKATWFVEGKSWKYVEMKVKISPWQQTIFLIFGTNLWCLEVGEKSPSILECLGGDLLWATSMYFRGSWQTNCRIEAVQSCVWRAAKLPPFLVAGECNCSQSFSYIYILFFFPSLVTHPYSS